MKHKASMVRSTRYQLLALIAVFASANVLANPVGFKLSQPRDSSFTPFLSIETGHNDNVTRENQEHDAISSGYVTIKPGAAYTFRPSAHRLNLLYVLDSGRYFDSSDDNYTDHYFESNNDISFNVRNNLELDYIYYNSHEDRGTGLTEGLLANANIDEPVKYTDNTLNVRYTYGAKGAIGQLRFGVKYDDRHYDNFRSLVLSGTETGSQYSDYQRFAYSAQFLYRLKATTHLTLSAKREDKEYQHQRVGVASRDSISDFYSAGAIWDISGKTQGEVSLGLQDKTFGDGQREDFTGFSWKAKATWTPLSHSQFTLATSQSAEDPNQFGDYVNETLLNLKWRQQWLERLSTSLLFNWENDDYTASNQSLGDREDDIFRYEFNVDYQFNHLLRFGFNWSIEDKDSTWQGYDFSQQLIGLNAYIEL
ncbi:outer membrane beta-barrel protein [Vibrio sp. SCSIO 43135]|uniref:outer membrane beta-barrel protein n=1 Tax=Vibrio sp. SCSIO 43135 TaxID=2819096 RepID=UPI002074F1B9|nr:outer membrane beta-barrel protein [Vibrio sp. SCSIO 43135]USD43111.1 outer membrane beta-barrel protein [Vibrio sp. SCSIO 43135]